MRTYFDLPRSLLAAFATLIAAIGTCLLIAASGHGVSPGLHLLSPSTLALAAVAAVGASWINAQWFDGLLRGPALVRGLKFGVIAWAWTAFIACLLVECGFTQSIAAHPLAFAFEALALFAVAGAVLGSVYGAGRHYDEYQWGMGYGLPDRRSIV